MNKYLIEDDVIQASIQSKKPSLPRDFSNAKMLLQQRSKDRGESLYDHLTTLLFKVINERPQNVMDYFEEFSRKISQEKIKSENILLAGTYVEPERLKCAKVLLPCLLESFSTDRNDGISSRVTDFTYLQFYWSLAGYGFPRAQIYALSCSIGLLANNKIIKDCRFWGRIFGLKLNYYVVEADLSEEETKVRMTSVQDSWGKIANRKTYFVCNCLGDDWIELPNLTQQQVIMSEKITKHLTGDLDAQVQSVPPFPDRERNLLRAVIYRITTETFVAPVGYYKINNVGGEEHITINLDYTPTESKKLLDLSAWNNYRPGLTNDHGHKLTLCSENSSQSMPLWTIRRIQQNFPKTSMVVIRSNIWPGALSFVSHREHDSIYVGWGVRYTNRAYVPPVPLTVEKEYDFRNTAENIQDAENTQDAANAQDAENAQGTENIEDSNIPQDVEENAQDAENAQGTENIEDNNIPQDAENAQDTGKTGDTEDSA